MPDRYEVEELRDHYYIIRGREDGDLAETRVFVDPAVLADLRIEGVSAPDVVTTTIDYLLERQRIDDLPTQVDIEDVAAAYDDFAEHLRTRLGPAQG
ncbi:MAG TPA: hypothetical protein GXZ45_13910 [Propionibacterium sp.]|nr:hypothetical protein [Propionibacterium sp.]